MNNQPKKFKLIISGKINPGWAPLPHWLMQNTNLPHNALLVLWCLYARKNEKGQCWPTIAKIAEDTRRSERTVKRALADLKDAGLITWEVRQQPNGNNLPNLYRVHVDEITKKLLGETWQTIGANTDPLGVNTAPRGDATCPPGGRTMAHKQETVNNNQLTINSAPKKRTRKKSATPLPPDWEPNPKHYELAAQKNVDINLEAEKFKDYATAHGKTYKDWDAAFRSWLRSPYCQPANKNPRAGASYDELAAFANQTPNPTSTRLLGG